jgi:hypothetical protein
MEMFLYDLVLDNLNQILIFYVNSHWLTHMIWFNNFSFQILVHVEENMKKSNIFIVLKNMFVMCYTILNSDLLV